MGPAKQYPPFLLGFTFLAADFLSDLAKKIKDFLPTLQAPKLDHFRFPSQMVTPGKTPPLEGLAKSIIADFSLFYARETVTRYGQKKLNHALNAWLVNVFLFLSLLGFDSRLALCTGLPVVSTVKARPFKNNSHIARNQPLHRLSAGRALFKS